MGISDRHRVDAAQPSNVASIETKALRDLVRARAELDRARRQAKWIRKCKELHRATRAVEAAALAARNAGIAWNDIGDVLGIDRAMNTELVSVAATPAPTEIRPRRRSRADWSQYGAAASL
jgi:hypothetical protein